MFRYLFLTMCMTFIALPAIAQHYRFEEGEGVDVIDDETGDVHGLLTGDGWEYSPDVPDIGSENNFSIDFTGGGLATMNGAGEGVPFVFHDAAVGGADGDATLDWWMKVPVAGSHASVFWTNGDGGSDTNRFNITFDLTCCGLPNNYSTGDYKDPGGVIDDIGAPAHDSGVEIPFDQWVNMRITRRDAGGGTWSWEWYYDGEHNPLQDAMTNVNMPDSLSWYISGRQGGHSLNALFDEIRMSGGAPAEETPTAHYRFEEGDGLDVVDTVSGSTHGTLVEAGGGAPAFSNDVPDIGSENNFSIDFTGGGLARMTGVPFILHDGSAGGAKGDARVEMYIKAPEQTHHGSVFWTNDDENGDTNRFNITHDLTCCGGDPSWMTGDYRDTTGAIADIGAPAHQSGVGVPFGEWSHVAINRVDMGGGSWGWEWYYNGERNPIQDQVTSVALPLAATWLICGRNGNHGANVLIDELKFFGETSGPDVCPTEGEDFQDTHCSGLDVIPPEEGDPPPAGRWTVIANAVDDSGDDINYTFSAEDEFLTPLAPLSQNGNEATFQFTEGLWTVSVTVDDRVDCDDEAQDSVCVEDIDVGPRVFVPYPEKLYYRFEEGKGDEVIDDITGDPHGVIMGGATYSEDVPVTDINGTANEFSINFVGGGWLRMSAFPFPFHDPFAGAAPGDVTLEWYINVPEPGNHSSMWWSNDDDQSDANRFNITHDLTCCGLPADYMTGDYRDAGGQLADIGAPGHNSGVSIQFGRWNHLAIIRTDNGDGTWSWTWYYNQEHNPIQDAFTDLQLPNAQTWLIDGRQGGNSNLNALFDEIRITTEALDPDDFLPPPVVCPSKGDADFQDTRCVSMEIDPEGGGEEGVYTVTATAEDDTGDDVTYRFRANDLFTELEPTLQDGNVAEFFLTSGVWTITCFIDDTGCLDTILDAPGGALCSEEVEIDPPPAPEPAYYRFEEGDGFEVTDDLSGDVHGELIEAVEYSSDVPIDPVPLTGEANSFSLDFTAGGFALIYGMPFVFHDPIGVLVGVGAPGDATLEWYMKVPAQGAHASIFWTNGGTGGAGRFNISHDLTCCNLGPDLIAGDYDGQDGVNENIGAPAHDSMLPLEFDQWYHLAITRTDNLDGSWTWNWFYNGERNPVQEATTFSPLPTARTWFIAGREGGHSVNALIDEVKMSHSALDPSEFLGAPGETVPSVGPFLRGDCDGNGIVGGTPTEAIVLLNYAFRGAGAPGCVAACDAEANGSIGITDALRILRFSFLGQGQPDAPFPDCARSEAESDLALGCEVSACTP